MEQLTFEKVIQERDQAMSQVAANAEISMSEFSARAEAFIVSYLTLHGETSGEDLTLMCRAEGIIPHDDRAFGPVYMRLSKSRIIEKSGTCIRKRGHGTAGGNIWNLVSPF